MLCVCVKRHRLLYVCGVEQYVGVDVERHGNVKQKLMGKFFSSSVERTQLFPMPKLRLEIVACLSATLIVSWRDRICKAWIRLLF